MTDKTKTSTITFCPVCNTPALWTEENAFRPFCSERCKLIDLGEWFNGAYEIIDEENEKV